MTPKVEKRITFFKLATHWLRMFLFADAYSNGYLWARSLKLSPMMLRDSLHNYGQPFDMGFYAYVSDLEHDEGA